MVMPKDIARSYPKRGLVADLGFKEKPFFCSDGAIEFVGYGSGGGPFINYSLNKTFTNFTVASWVLIDGKSTYNYFMGAGGSGSFGGLVHFGWINGTTNPQLRLQDGKRSIAYIPSQTFPEVIGQWCHVACTINSAGDSIKMYVNGIEATGLTQPTSGNEIEMPGSDGSSIGHFQVGSFQYNASAQTLGIGGKMANFGLYDAELTQDQIIQLMRGNDFATCSAVATPAVFFELFENNTDSTGNAGTITDTGTPYYGYSYAQLPRGLDLARGRAQAKFHTGRCVDFDGSTDFLDMGNGVDKNYTTRSDRASFSFWFNMDQISSAAFLYQNRTQVGGTDRPECETQVFTTSSGLFFDGEGASIKVPAANLNLNQWHHFVGIADDSDGPVKVYLDGNLYDTTDIAQAGANGSEFLIGGRNNSPLQLFNGQLSNFKIFNVELTQAQVHELYHNPEMVIPTGVSASNLRRHYPLCAFNDTSGFGGRHESDQGVEGVNGEYGGSPVMSFAQPVPCPQLGLQQSATRLRFPGGSTTHNAVATTAALGTTASVSCWFQVENTSSTRVLWAIGNATGTGFLEVFVNSSDQLQVYGQSAFTIATITDSDWHHLVVTTDSGSPPYKAFLDNSEVSLSGSDTARNLTNGTFEIGNQDTAAGAFVFQGILNDVACWNTELGSSDVSALYNSGVMGMDVGTVQASNLKGWWKCDDLSTLKDYSGNGANATVTNTFTAVQFPENASGSTLVGDISMKRKGVSVLNCHNVDGLQQVRTEIPSGAGVQPSLTNGHTVSLWYRNQMQNTTSANNGTFLFSGDGTTSNRYFLESLNGNTFRGAYGNIQVTGTGTVSDNDWHHYAMCLDMSTSPNPTLRLYLDGVADNTGSSSLGTTFPEDTTFVGYMGANRAPHNYELKGPIACVRIYNTQLSANEIKEIYHADERLLKGLNNE